MPKDTDSTIKFKADITDLKASMQEAGRYIRLANSEFKAATAGMDNWSKSADGLSAKTKQLNTVLQAQKQQLGALEADYKKVVAEQGENSKGAEELKIKINNQKAAIAQTESQLDKYESELRDVATETKNAGDEAEKAANGGFTILKGAMANLVSQGITAALDGLRNLGSTLIDVGKQAISSYADYEQLVGGIETLFGAGGQTLEEYAASIGKTVDEARGEYNKLTQAQATVMANASQAYATVGMSANEYMENVTSFSAALTSSLGGDTVQAAISADQALRDISDNANKMGSDIDSITQAYQGFARGQYTLLDNLKLGYGGTQAEMERLLADATAISGVEYNIDNLSDVYEAIHVVQTEMGITGTTAREAASTISGSTQMVSAAWQNLLTGIADDNADFEGLVNNLIDSIMTAADNLLPRIQTTIEGLGQLASALLERLVPQLINMIPPLLQSGLPILLNAVNSVLTSILSVLPQVIPIISGLIPQICSSLLSLLPQVVSAGISLILSLISGISEAIPQLLEMLPSIIEETVTTLINQLPLIIETGITLLNSLIEGITLAIPQLVEMLPRLTETFINVLTSNLPSIISMGITLLVNLINGIISALPQLISMTPRIISTTVNVLRQNMPQIIASGKLILTSLINGITSLMGNLRTKAGEIFNTVKNKLAELPSALINIGKDLVRGLWNGINDMTGWVISKIQGFGESVLSGIRDFFGINSPSTLFRDEVGKWLPPGITVGFEEAMPTAIRNMAASARDMAQEIANEMAVPLDDIALSAGQARGIQSLNGSSGILGTGIGSNSGSGQTINFNQTINSPEPVNRLTVFRDTNSLLFSAGVRLNNV